MVASKAVGKLLAIRCVQSIPETITNACIRPKTLGKLVAPDKNRTYSIDPLGSEGLLEVDEICGLENVCLSPKGRDIGMVPELPLLA